MDHNSCSLTGHYLSQQFGAGPQKWTTLSHNGVLFPNPYIPHNIPLLYNNDPIHLEPEAEELATLYAKFTDTIYIKDSTFRKNFWKDWAKVLGKDSPIQSFDQCDFKLIYEYLLKQKEIKKQDKPEKQDFEQYKTAIVDGKVQPVGNFRMEPPGIFLGRGCSPLVGKIKKRIYPEDITINIGKESPIPEIPSFYPNHNWQTIIHNQYVTWLASWKDDITGKTKYVWGEVLHQT